MGNLKKNIQLIMLKAKYTCQEMSKVSLLLSVSITILNTFQNNTVYCNTVLRFLHVLATHLQSIIVNIT